MEIFRSILQGFLPFSPVSLTELCSFWYGLKDLFTLHKLVDKVVLDNKKTDDVIQAVGKTWTRTHKGLRAAQGRKVKQSCFRVRADTNLKLHVQFFLSLINNTNA